MSKFILSLESEEMWALLSALEGHADEYYVDSDVMSKTREAIKTFCINAGYRCEDGGGSAWIWGPDKKGTYEPKHHCFCFKTHCVMRLDAVLEHAAELTIAAEKLKEIVNG